MVSFLGTTVLDKLLGEQLGEIVSVTYKGDQKSSGGFNVKQFDVQIWDDNMVGDDEKPNIPELVKPVNRGAIATSGIQSADTEDNSAPAPTEAATPEPAPTKVKAKK